MGTKWKSKKEVFLILLLFSFGCSVFFTNIFNSPEFLKKNYFETNRFHSEYNTFLNFLGTYQLSEFDPVALKKHITVSAEEIDNHRYEYGDLSEQVTNLKEQYESRISEAKRMGNLEVSEILQKELDAKIKDITLNFTSDEHVRKKIIAQKEKQIDESYQTFLANKASNNPYNLFEYYLEDEKTGQVYTSLPAEEAKAYRSFFDKDNMRYVKAYDTKNNALKVEDGRVVTQLPITANRWNDYIGYYGEESFVTETGLGHEIVNEQNKGIKTFKGFIGIPKDVSASDRIIVNANKYRNAQISIFSCLLTGLIVMGIALYTIKRRGVVSTIQLSNWQWYSRIPVDLRLILVVCTFVYIAMLFTWSHVYDFENVIRNVLPYIFISTWMLVLGVYQVATCINNTIEKGYEQEIQSALVLRIIHSIRDAFLNRSIGMQMLMLLVIVPFLGLFIGLFFAMGMGATGDSLIVVALFGVIVLVVGMPILYILFKHAGYLSRIIQAVNGIVYGKNEPDLEIKGKSALADLARDVNLLKHGVKTSQKEQVKSERLKTELITNVSHDLRTPLTSIITYTDLLKSTDVTEDERQSYIEIIDRKSKRLKVLIDDLFEASKMATGNIELVKSKVEIVQLLQQTLAEHDEEIASSQLQFRVSHDQQPIEAIVDGQKLYRVFDNLILNILKYSLPHTRVYIAVKNTIDDVEISFKNVSQFELGGNVDELFERFKRGDQSRHTEGSGLGLAIAKSIVDLHEGEMDIDVDGDLFKVTITLKKRV
ncbi:sensor histidine kinase [Bacillus massiliigorillae]|uniref:sensor histidine kinase n=1 Tax=Bacillus massiliigorillae TaxID=1243664 RepID=UPI0003A30D72|nr:HAMP domain-containing sensor histidine kinase [Bacillus massiliigorillae]